MYRYATTKPHGFLYVDLHARSLDRMFSSGFSQRLIPEGDRIRVEAV